ncbi:MAG TPA: branched-chain amino acid ABC transporter permease, partial [Rhodospirillales bacterium]|nr:branched-chain amino acid ABC transporter permease [Rhodospirillales bacterium]
MDKKYSPWAILILVTIVLAFLPSFGDRYALFIAYFLVLNVAFAQSWNLVGGYTGLIALGHAAFFGIGAYAAAISIITFELPVVAGFIIGGLASTAFAFLISFPTFRFRGIYFAIGTLVLAEALRIWMINWEFIGGAQGMQFPIGIGFRLSGYFYIMLGLAVGSTALLMYILRSKLGVGLRAIR